MVAKAGPVGAFCDFKHDPWPASVTTQAQCWAMWNSQTSTTAQACKIFYFNLSQFPTAMDYQTTAAANLGITPVICCKPDYTSNTTMANDLVTFTQMCTMLQANFPGGGYIVLWQEPQNGGKTPVNPTAAQFVNLFKFDPNGTGIGAYHAAANAAGFQLTYDAVSHSPSKWAPYMPPAEFLDAVAVDYYCDLYLGTGGIRIHGTGSIMDLADTATTSGGKVTPLPFGIFEIGVTPGGTSQQPTQAQMAQYLAYLEQIMGWNAAGTVGGEALPAGRLFQGKANAPVMWFNGQVSQTLNQVVPLATASYSQAAYVDNTGYPNLYQALQPQGGTTLTITTSSVPNGVVGSAYSTTLGVMGGSGAYTWTVSAGSLPPGLTLHAATGVIDGTPSTATGSPFSFTVQVADTASHTDTQALTITVSVALSVTTTTLPNGTVGTPYNQSVGAQGGTPPYTWSHTGTLPPGLSGLTGTSSPAITGTPTTSGGYTITAKVTDSVSATATQPLTLTVASPVSGPVRVTPAIPGMATPGTFTPGLQGTAFPLEPLYTTATPGRAQPGTFSPGDPGSDSLPPIGPAYTPSTPGQAVPGLFRPGDPGAAILPPAGVPFIVQQMFQTATFNYGWSAAEFSGNATGNMLVVMAGWDLNATGTSAPMPAAYVCDSALNYWYHAGTTTSSNTGSRCSIWVAPNADPVEWVSCSLTTFASSLAYTVLEIGNAPQFFTIDVSSATSDLGNTVLNASPGFTGSADLGLACMVRGSTVGGLSSGPAGWAELGEAQAGTGAPNGVSLFPFWNAAVPAGTDVTVGYVTSNSAPLSAVTVLIEAAPNPPVQGDPDFPLLKVEAAFGFSPGDPTQSPPGPPGAASDTIWTDITARCAAKDGTPYIAPVLGKSYELAQPETGELAISCDNHDGIFTPGNVNSPLAPGTGVQLGTPVRVSAYWGGSWFNVAFGYVERWPQEWPDVPQWGMSAMIAADAFSALSAARSYSALNGDMLLDAPYSLHPCFEQYTTQTNSLNSVVSSSECQGLLAANIAQFNQRTGTYVDGTSATCATGQSTTLLGSQDTGFGCSQFTAPLTLTSSGPGMIYWDPNLPSPLAPSGLSVEFWLTINPPGQGQSPPPVNQQPTVFTAFSAASNYQTGHPNLQIQVQNATGQNQLQVTFANGTTMFAPFAPSVNPQQVVLVFGGGVVSLFVNGALSASTALTAAQAGNWQALMLGCGNYAYHNGTLVGGVFTAFSLAVYPYQLPVQRIVSHYVTGVSGQQNVDATTRIAQVLAWTALGIPRGGRVTFNGVPAPVLQGPAYSLSNANVSSILNQVTANEQGMLFVSPDGTLQFAHRWALFNQAPQAVFGDAPALGEIPFMPGQSFDYDNSYLFNIDQVTQTIGPTTGITVTSADTNSAAQYFNRSILQVGIQTMSNLDAYDIANSSIATYSQPQIRLRGLTVDAAANPQVAFPGVLGLQQGNAATVNRRPVGAAMISANVIVQKVSHSIGPKIWQTSYEMSPYAPLDAVLQLDAPLFDVIGQNVLP